MVKGSKLSVLVLATLALVIILGWGLVRSPLAWNMAAAPLPSGQTTMRVTTVTIPTHPVDQALTYYRHPTYNIYYSRLDRGRYDPGRIENRTYHLIILENDYLKLTFLPELGGRIYQAIFKPTGHNLFYQNPVVKPSPWGPSEMGWWLAVGGVEWCLPVEEHGYEWGIPWSYRLVDLPDGARVELWDTNATDRLRAKITVTLPDDAAYFQITPTLENPTGGPIDYKFWLNAMLAPGGINRVGPNLRLLLPASQVTVHSTGDRRLPGPGAAAGWPVHNGVDWSRLGNWREWYGFFQRPRAAGDFQAVYDEDADEGLVRTYDSRTTQGAKFFGFGYGPSALSPDLYTDGDSAYVEIHGGVGPTFADTRRLEAHTTLTWDERWYPVAGLGSLTWANDRVALSLETNNGLARLRLAASAPVANARLLLLRRSDNQLLYEEGFLDLRPDQPYQSPLVPATGLQPSDLAVAIYSGDMLLAAYQYNGGPPVTPGPGSSWQGRLLRTIPIAGWSSVVRVWVRNQAGRQVTIATEDGTWQTTGIVGTKPEYGSDALEFAPLGPGTYIITPQGLNTSFRLELAASTIAEVLFEPAAGPVLTATPTRTPTATPTRTPSPTATPSPSPRPSPTPSVTPTPAGGWTGRVRRITPIGGWAGVVRIWTGGRPGLPVTLASAYPTWSWQATAYSGSKAEYGLDALEFAPLPPVAYILSVPDLQTRFEFQLQPGTITEIVFEPGAPPLPTPTATAVPSATPTLIPSPLPTASRTPTPSATPTATATRTPSPTASPSPAPTSTPTATPTPSRTPTPATPGWRVRVPANTVVPGNWFAVIRVSVAGRVGWPVRLTIVSDEEKPWTTTCSTGSKPEYGPDFCEFAPLVPAQYTIAPEGLDVATTLTMGRGGVAIVIFEQE